MRRLAFKHCRDAAAARNEALGTDERAGGGGACPRGPAVRVGSAGSQGVRDISEGANPP